MSYLFWLSVAVALLIVEIIAPAFFFIFFAFSALLTAALVFFAILGGIAMEVGFFSVIAVLSLLLMRKRFAESLKAAGIGNFAQNEKITLDTDISPNGEAQITYQGTVWTAVNDSGQPMARGEKVIIARTEGVKLILMKQG